MLGNCSTVSKLFSAVVKLFLRVCSCASQLAGSPSAVLTGPRFARNCATCASNSRSRRLMKSVCIGHPPHDWFVLGNGVPASAVRVL